MSEPVFTLTDVSFSYTGSIHALRDCSLVVKRGTCAAIIGANGTGKSTLLTLMDALVFAQHGSITAFGEPLTAKRMNNALVQREFRSKVGFVFQNPDIQLFCPTVREDIVFGPLQLGVSKEEIRRRLDVVVDRLRLGRLLERAPHQLSIGEKKKAAIASVLVMQPQVLLLDEPTAGLDPQTTRDIIQVLVDVRAEGKTVVMATHDLHIVEEIADVVHVFGDTRAIIRSGDVETILKDTAFMRENNLIHIHVHRHLHEHHSHSH